MGDVINVDFGVERDWETTHQKIIEGLVTIGELYGDDPELMRSKAECVYSLIRRIVSDMPPMKINLQLPKEVSKGQVELMTQVIKEAGLKGIEMAMMHAVQCIMVSIYDMCTSKLEDHTQSEQT